MERGPCHTSLLGLAEDNQTCIRDLGNPGRRRWEDGCSAALASNFQGSEAGFHQTHTHRRRLLGSHCGRRLLVDNAGHGFVAHYTDSIYNTVPADGSGLYQVEQVLIAVCFDFVGHGRRIALSLLVSLGVVVRAATSHPCFGPCLGTFHRHNRSHCLGMAIPHCIRRIHPFGHCYSDIPAEAHLEVYQWSGRLELLGCTPLHQGKVPETTNMSAHVLGMAVAVGRRVVAVEHMPWHPTC